MKSLIKRLVTSTAQNPMAWTAYRACGAISRVIGKPYHHALFVRGVAGQDELMAEVLRECCPDLVVARGPFQGLRYPTARSVQSALLPKLLGSYESELHPILEEMLRNDYDTIVNIGCGEGYYAIGLALKFPRSRVYAFDTDPEARESCRAMAKLNDVVGRVFVGEFCDSAALAAIPLGRHSLIVSDCEGYERQLFNPAAARQLAAHDLIIETHDFIDIEASLQMRAAFDNTHTVRSIRTLGDITRAQTYQCPELSRYTLNDKRHILSERRPAIMEWLVMTPKMSVRSKCSDQGSTQQLESSLDAPPVQLTA